ncbi:ABC transporter ATP-binding protein [Paludifilum halophilum]|uniref:Spermidine/putrescine ABC transporter ATP-binding protein n=1 Tax=Paludifilum halophilum TaxID=1642702 RepID=A0A235B9K2_9BACL|nr:ABC transporter ATP-binding protein [Paludifilum halophilum]OYD08946.1 spermidine/putrescine ABC transporter ATP-binding protein [Paludifilum halophilum]
MIRLQGVSKRYLRKKALMDVDLQLPTGKIIGVIGENGSGKSTMLKLISGLVRPSSGTVTVDGEKVDRRTARKVSYLSELDTYYPFFTVQETIDYYASQFADFDGETSKEILSFMGVDPAQKVKHLSKGYRSRVKILLVLSRKVPYILMDEPLSGLDPMVRDSIIKGLISFVDLEKQTVVLTTHEVNEMEPLLDMIVAVRDGEVIKVADVEELRRTENKSIAEWMNDVYAGNTCRSLPS